MKILLLQDRPEVREKVVFLLESTYGGRVFEASTLPEGMDQLSKATTPFDLIILDTKVSSGPEMDAFRVKSGTIPTLITVQGNAGGNVLSGNVVGFVDRSTFIDNITTSVNELIQKGMISNKKSEEAQVRIRTRLLLSVSPLQGDIYIQLSGTKFLKLFRQGDVFDRQDLEKYTVQKGVEYLYIKREQCEEFARKYKLELDKMLKSENVSIEDVSKLGESVQESVQELNKQIGFTKEVQELAKTQVQLTVKAMGKDPKLADIIAKLQASEGKYIASHSNLCAFLACSIAGQLKWGSETTFYKLSLAAFMHDVTLENHELAEMESLDDLEKNKAKFTEKELKEFKDHPIFAAEMAKKMSEVPPDVDTIILQHHERPDGSGFPRGLNHSYIAPLASIFIVAHDLSKYTLKAGANFSVDKFLEGARGKYKSMQFKKIMTCLETIRNLKTLSASINQARKS